MQSLIGDTLSCLTSDKTLSEDINLLDLISQRKSISTPDISNDETSFSVSSTEQASSADNLFVYTYPKDNATDVKLTIFYKFLLVKKSH